MSERNKIREELRTQQAERLLANQGTVPRWELPPDYLARMTNKVLAESEIPQPRVVHKRWLHLRYVAAAAVVLLALGLWYVSPSEGETASPPTLASWDDIPTEDLQAYVTNHLDEFEVDLLAAYTLSTADDNPPLPGHGISTEALEEYLEADDWLLETEISDPLFEN
jgi:hypothetical protein